jgi:hypothetical protein
LARLRAYPYGHDGQLADVARDSVARRLRLHPDPRLSKDAQSQKCWAIASVRTA